MLWEKTRKEKDMNGYIALYKDKKIEVYAETSYAAQCKAAAELKAKKQHEVSVYLVEKAGEPVVLDPAIL
tara:strand:+ start:309 stop:518 length:210 start_codon:yes stop_codon:yes gene_type:complete